MSVHPHCPGFLFSGNATLRLGASSLVAMFLTADYQIYMCRDRLRGVMIRSPLYPLFISWHDRGAHEGLGRPLRVFPPLALTSSWWTGCRNHRGLCSLCSPYGRAGPAPQHIKERMGSPRCEGVDTRKGSPRIITAGALWLILIPA